MPVTAIANLATATTSSTGSFAHPRPMRADSRAVADARILHPHGSDSPFGEPTCCPRPQAESLASERASSARREHDHPSRIALRNRHDRSDMVIAYRDEDRIFAGTSSCIAALPSAQSRAIRDQYTRSATSVSDLRMELGRDVSEEIAADGAEVSLPQERCRPSVTMALRHSVRLRSRAGRTVRERSLRGSVPAETWTTSADPVKPLVVRRSSSTNR